MRDLKVWMKMVMTDVSSVGLRTGFGVRMQQSILVLFCLYFRV
jgi:hypothetical protein